jgi:glyceraldehyde-3-phosphate dehydrogenase (NADP+)
MAKRYKILIGGRWLSTESELKVVNPYNGGVAGSTSLAGPGELDSAAAAAESSFEALKAMPSYRRAELIRKVVDGIEGRSEELAMTISQEAGKPIRDARAEVRRAAGTFRLAAEEAVRIEGALIPLDTAPGAEGRYGIVKRFPVGTILGITPFNFPLNLVAHKVAPAMACGCPIILKPASKTPLTALMLGETITEAGWPAGGVNVVPCSVADAEALLDDPRIRKLSFTGSPEVGWRLKEKAGQRKATLELGGNAGVIVHEDADLGYAAKRCVAGAFSYAGQVCISVQRIYAHESVFARFRDELVERCGQLKGGDPLEETTDLGPMIDEDSAIRAEAWVKEAVQAGAKVLAGGLRRGAFLDPTVLTHTDDSMKVCSKEAFAPVVVLEPYSAFEDAVERVNKGPYGLQAGVFTGDIGRVFHAYERLDVGAVVVNDVPTFRVDNMPYGGVKASGFGREGVRYAIEEMTEPKLLALKP